VNEFIEEIINAAHMRLLSPDWEIIKNGYDILDTIPIRIHDEPEITNDIKTETDKVTKDYSERLKQIDVIHDKIRKNKERYLLEFDRLKHMIQFYDVINNKL